MTRGVVTFAFLMIVLSVSAFAQGSGSSSSVARAKPERPFAVTKTMMGKIAEINATKLVLENEHGAKKEFKLDNKTKFRLSEKKSVKLEEVKPGLRVKVTFREADLTATMVQETVKKFQE